MTLEDHNTETLSEMNSAVRETGESIESLTTSLAEFSESDALKVISDARQKRAENCSKAVNELLEQYDCQFLVVFKVGDQNLLAGKLVNLPHQVLIGSR